MLGMVSRFSLVSPDSPSHTPSLNVNTDQDCMNDSLKSPTMNRTADEGDTLLSSLNSPTSLSSSTFRGRRVKNSIKKSLETYHENMYGFFGIELEKPDLIDVETTSCTEDQIQALELKKKEEKLLEIKKNARARMLKEMDQVYREHDSLI